MTAARKPGKPYTLAIIQARMSSSRLPAKVLQDIAGKPMLLRVVERARQASTVDGVVVATTSDLSDDAVAALCTQHGLPFYRGSLHDVLDRYYEAARQFGAEVIVRVTGDFPLIDPGVIDTVVNAFLAGDSAGRPYDFAANRLPPPWKRTYPIGLDTEVCTFQALERAWKEASLPHEREHVMPYLYEEEGRFRVLVLDYPQDYGSYRWTVDTPEDLELVRQIYARLPDPDHFTFLDVIELFEREPDLAKVNQQVKAKDYRDVDERQAGKTHKA